MTPYEIIPIPVKLSIITGVVFLIIYKITSYFLRKKAFEKIKSNLEKDEFIISTPKLDWVIEIIVPFLLGCFIGAYILPFFIHPEIQYIKSGYTGSINREYLPLCMIAVIVLTFFYFWLASIKFVLTNKRMINAWSFEFLYAFINFFHKFEYLYYSDIGSFVYENSLMTKVLYLYTKDNKWFHLSGFKNLDDFGLIIEKYR